jgi:CubicO group peptidase (beta-lactamase class C family)
MMGTRRTIAFIISVIGFAVPGMNGQSTAAPELTRGALETWLDEYMTREQAEKKTAGAVVVVVKNGEVLLEKGYGFADLARHIPVDPERTLFRAGSVSKLFTWTAVMQQVEQGKIDLDRDVNAYLDFKIPPREGKPITMRNLMTHTPGFEDWAKDLWSSNPKGVGSLATFIKRWVPGRIYAPGTMPAYSNYGTALAAYIVTRVSGLPFDDYMDRNIFGRLGMAHSSFRQPLPEHLRVDVTQSYGGLPGPVKPYEMLALPPAGSLSATGADMAKFMIAHLEGGRYGGAQLLRPETVAMMHDTSLTILPPLNRMLLGFYEKNRNGRRIIGHDGDTQFNHALLRLVLDDHVGIYIAVNTADGYKLRSDLFTAFINHFFPAPDSRSADETVDPKTAAQHARMIAGGYDNSKTWRFNFPHIIVLLAQERVVANADGSISIEGEPDKWREFQPFVWRKEGSTERLAAKIENGKVVRFSYDELSPFMMFNRTSFWESAEWLLPLLKISVAVLLLAVLLWPVAWIVRRVRAKTLSAHGDTAVVFHLMGAAALASVLIAYAWFSLLSMMLADYTTISSALDGHIWFLHIATAVVCVGAGLIAIWNAWLEWANKRPWFARAWSAVLVIACLTTFWVAFTFKLIAFSVNY